MTLILNVRGLQIGLVTGLCVFLMAASAAKAEDSSDLARYQSARQILTERKIGQDIPGALAEMRQLAEKGFDKAQGFYGFLYAQGVVVAHDDAVAREWLRKAADRGLRSAQLNLGMMLLAGTGGEKRPEEGIALITQAAEGGEVAAQAKLAEFAYFGHEAFPQNDKLAGQWALKAAEQGDAWSQNLFGSLLEFGKLGPVDRKAVMEWYRKAAEKGNAKAQANLGRLYESGLVGERDIVEAYFWLWQGVEQGEPTAINYLKDLVPGMTAEEREAALKRIGKVEGEEPGANR